VSMNNLARMAQQMQAEMAKVQAEVEALIVETSAGGGAVKAVVNGRQEVVSVTIDPAAVDADDVEMLQDLITAAVNDGLRQVRDTATQKMARVTGGMRLPGLG
jgi:DNA-binding YbaB/EbfC family protein